MLELRTSWICVVHLAGRGGVRRSIAEPKAYMELNYGATLNVLEGMREAGAKRLVFASTSSVYGNSAPTSVPASRSFTSGIPRSGWSRGVG